MQNILSKTKTQSRRKKVENGGFCLKESVIRML